MWAHCFNAGGHCFNMWAHCFNMWRKQSCALYRIQMLEYVQDLHNLMGKYPYNCVNVVWYSTSLKVGLLQVYLLFVFGHLKRLINFHRLVRHYSMATEEGYAIETWCHWISITNTSLHPKEEFSISSKGQIQGSIDWISLKVLNETKHPRTKKHSPIFLRMMSSDIWDDEQICIGRVLNTMVTYTILTGGYRDLYFPTWGFHLLENEYITSLNLTFPLPF